MSRSLFILIFFLTSTVAFSTHLRGGQIRVVSTSGLTCRIEIRLLTNTGSPIKAGEGLLDFGDGTNATTETKENTLVPGQAAVGLAVYVFEHTYAAPGTYVLSYTEPNLTGGILNIFNSVETRFYIESVIVLTSTNSVSSPRFPTDPIFVCPSRRPYSFSTASIDDSTRNDFYYKYYLVAHPKPLGDYRIPGNLALNEDNGIVTWDTKFNGEYVAGMFWIVVQINKYSKTGGYQGYVQRAMQIIVEDSDSKIDLTSPGRESNNEVLVPEGAERKVKMILSDKSTTDNLHFDVYYNKVIKKNVSITQYDSIAGNSKLRVAILSLKTTPDISTDLPYPITLRGYASYRTDITFLYKTKNVDVPVPPVIPGVVTEIQDEEDIKVYPNPFRSEIYIDGGNSTDVTILNSLGHVVMKSRLQQGQAVNTASLPSGIYFLQIEGRRFKVLRE